MRDQERYSVGETAMITGISANTLRYYDNLNLINPEIRDPQNNYRYYSKEQVIRLLAVQRLRRMNCSQQKLRTLLEENSLTALCNQIELRTKELQEEIAERIATVQENERFLKRLREFLDLQEQAAGGSDLLYDIRIEEIPKTYLFFEQRVMPQYNVCDTSVSFRLELYSECKAHGLEPTGSEITTYFTNLLGQFVMQDCKIQIGIEVDRNPGCGKVCDFGGFTAATAIHIGSYNTMVNTHMRLLRWISQNGYEVVGNVSEEFFMSPIDILDQSNQIIKVIMPVREAAPEKGI